MPAISSQIHYTTKIPKSRLIQTEILIEPASHMTTNFLNKKVPKIHHFLKNRKEGWKLKNDQLQFSLKNNKD